MPNYANGAKKKKQVKPSKDEKDPPKQKSPVDPADMAALIAAKTARKVCNVCVCVRACVRACVRVCLTLTHGRATRRLPLEARRRRRRLRRSSPSTKRVRQREGGKRERQKRSSRSAQRSWRRRRRKRSWRWPGKKGARLSVSVSLSLFCLCLSVSLKAVVAVRTLESLTSEDDPQAIAQCVARSLGFSGASLKPKEILAKAIERMPEIDLPDGLPKEQLMVLVRELVARRAAKRAHEAEKAAAKAERAKQLEKQRAVAEREAEAKREEEAAAKQLLEARVAEKKQREKALQRRDPNLAEQQQQCEGSGTGSDYRQTLTKEQIKAARRAEARAATVVREAQQLESEILSALQASARARIAGGQQVALGTIETGEFSLPNPGGGPDLLDQASLVLVPGRRYGLVGRNGKGKSTLLKYLSARRVGRGALPTSLSVHYVSQTSADEMGNEAEVAEGEQYKFLAVAGKDKYWREMSTEEQSAALHLGWAAESWDAGDASPMEGLHWGGMNPAQVSAAEVLGHSAATWDLEMTPEAAAAAEAAAESIRAEAAARRAGPRPVEVVLRADMERSMLMEQVAALEATDEDLSEEQHLTLEAAHERLREIGASSAVGRATTLLKNLGFSDELISRSVRELSGGWRVRVALAAALFAAPDVLLLDEPTNHLSIEAVIWLQHELSTNPDWDNRILIVVSHDRTFLDAVCTDSLHISGAARRLTQERGNYSAWAKRRVARKAAWGAKCKKREVEMSHMREMIARGGSYQNASIQRKMKQDQLSQLEREAADDAHEQAALQEDEELALTIHAGGRLDQPPIKLSDVTFGYPGSKSGPLFERVELCVDCGSRLVLLGENGRGKTTLVKLMLGELQPTRGTVQREQGSRVALLNQHHADQLDLDKSPLDFLASQYRQQHNGAAVSRELYESMRAHLTSCGIAAELQLVPGRGLSGGQRSRLALACVSFLRPHVLVLDEPTNNLDVESVVRSDRSFPERN